MPEVKVSQEHAEEMATRIRDLLTADTRKAVETYFTRDSYAGTAFNLLGDNEATSRQVVYEALCSDLELLAQPAMSAGTTS